MRMRFGQGNMALKMTIHRFGLDGFFAWPSMICTPAWRAARVVVFVRGVGRPQLR
jgi:hypothetical protein